MASSANIPLVVGLIVLLLDKVELITPTTRGF